MKALERNKIAAALLLGLLVYKGIQIIAEDAFELAGPETSAYVVAGLKAEEPELAVAAAEEEPAPAEDVMALLASASPERGQRVFRRCQACHDLSEKGGHKIGPNLFGVIGAPVARHADFRYSDALAGRGGTWDFALINDYLRSPAESIPGNKMSFGGLAKAGERAALIAYLNSNSSSPLPLPEAPAAPAPEPAAEEAQAAISEAGPEIALETVEQAAEESAQQAVEQAAEQTLEGATPAPDKSSPDAEAEEDAGEAVAGESTPEPDQPGSKPAAAVEAVEETVEDASPEPADAPPVEGDEGDEGGEGGE